MNTVRNTTNDARNSSRRVELIEDVKLMTKEMKPMDENEKRATEIGPVMEEILRSHWEHWGLND